MSKYNFRILLETVQGRKTSYLSQSFVDTSVDLVLSASQVYNRITGSISASYQNKIFFSGSTPLSSNDINSTKIFKDNTLLSASLSGSVDTGSIIFTALDTDYDRLLRYKFFGEKVCNTLGLPHSQWVYVDQLRLPADNEQNIFEGNVRANNLFVSDTLTMASDANINSDVPFLIDTGSDRHIKFVDERGFSTTPLIIGYDKDLDTYEISGSDDKNFNIGGVDKIFFADGTSQTTAGGGGGTPGGSNTQVQFNDGGSFGGDAGFTYDKDDNSITTINNITASGNISSSGNIISSRITASSHISSSGDITSTNYFAKTAYRFVADNVRLVEDTIGKNLEVTNGGLKLAGHITASGNISSSGTGIFNKVGIGISNPGQGLHVVDAGGIVAEFESSDNTTAMLHIENSAGEDGYVGVTNAGLVFSAQNFNSNNMILDTSGNVGIGTTTPSKKLEVEGDISASKSFVLGDISGGESSISASNGRINITGSYGSLSGQETFILGGNAFISQSLTVDKFQPMYFGRLGAGASLQATAGGVDAFTIDSNIGDLILRAADDIIIALDSTSYAQFAGHERKFVMVGSASFSQNVVIGGGSSDVPIGNTKLEVLGDLRATGDIIANRYIVSSSVTHLTQSFSSGSTIFGDTPADDTHQFTGSVFISGSTGLDVIGNITASGNISGSSTSTGSLGYLTIEDKIQRSGDTDTFINFSNDAQTFSVGGIDILTLQESTSDEVIVGDGSNSVTFRVKTPSENDTILVDPTLKLVGFGKSPGNKAKVDVDGNIRASGAITSSGNISASGNLIGDKINLGTAGTGHISSSHSNLVGFETDSATNKAWQLFTGNTAGQLKLYKDNSEVIRINANDGATSYINNGELAIGATSTINGATLGVTGNVSVSTNITASSHISSSGDITSTNHFVKSAYRFVADNVRLVEDTTGTNLSVTGGGLKLAGNITASGNISASGASFEQAVDGGNALITIKNTNTDNGTDKGVGIEFKHCNTVGEQPAGAIIAGKENTYFAVGGVAVRDSDLRFFVSENGTDTERLRIMSTGNTGIGTTNPTTRLQVEGVISSSGGISGSGNISGFTSASFNYITASIIDLDDNTLRIGGESVNKTLIQNLKRGHSSVTLSPAGRIQKTTDVFVQGNISASGFISTQGAITASGDISSSGFLQVDSYIQTDSHITASGNITSIAAVSGSGGNYIGNRRFNKTSNTTADHSGDIVYFGGTTGMDNGKIYHFKNDGTWEIANADAASTSDGLLGVALGTNSDVDGVLLRGTVTLDHDPGAVGDVLFLQSDNAGTPGQATATAPSANNNVVRVVGYLLDSSNHQIWFNPSSTFVEVSA